MEKEFENPIEMVNQITKNFKTLCGLAGIELDDLSLKNEPSSFWDLWFEIPKMKNPNDVKALKRKYQDNPEKMNQVIRFFRSAVYLNLERLKKALSN